MFMHVHHIHTVPLEFVLMGGGSCNRHVATATDMLQLVLSMVICPLADLKHSSFQAAGAGTDAN